MNDQEIVALLNMLYQYAGERYNENRANGADQRSLDYDAGRLDGIKQCIEAIEKIEK